MHSDPHPLFLLREGNEQAFEKMYRENRDEFLLWAVRNNHISREDAKDLYQVVLIILYENIVQGKLVHLSSSTKTYIYGIAKNKLKEWKRTKDKKTISRDAFVLGMDIENDDDATPRETFFQRMELGLKQMDKKCRELLKSYYYHKKSMADIKDDMDYKNVQTTKNMKYKCLQRLKTIVEKLEILPNNPTNKYND